MYKIYIIILSLGITFADIEESNEKYIDLLPEEEKQEFLNRIARRILETINSDDTPNQSHVEINDEQLNEHDSFVQDIIDKESENLKNEKKLNSSETKDDRFLDLTLQAGEREITSEPDLNVVSVKLLYDDDHNSTENEKKFARNEKTDNTTPSQVMEHFHTNDQVIHETKSIISRSDTENINATETDLNRHLMVNKTGNMQIDYIESNITDDTHESSTKNIIETVFENNIGAETNLTIFSNKSILDEILGTSTQNNSEEEQQIQLNNKKLSNNFQLTTPEISNISRDSVSTFSEMETNTRNTRNSSIKSKNDENSIKEDDIIYKLQLGTLGNETSNFTKLVVLKSSTIDPNKINITGKSRNMEENRSMEENVNKDMARLENGKRLTTTPYNDVKSDNKENLANQFNVKGERRTPKLKVAIISPKNEYKVYEIDAKKSPFTLIKDVNKRPPYKQIDYVPLYNYAPENAYFKPVNRFSPDTKYNGDEDSYEKDLRIRISNVDSKNEFEFNLPVARSRFLGYKKKNHVTLNQNKVLNPKFNLLRPNKKVLNENIRYNPYDYIDLDYGFDRNENNLRSANGNTKFRAFPVSDELDQPVKSIHGSEDLKNHIRTARKFMALQKILGLLPDVPRGFNQYVNPKISDERIHVKTSNGISADYYFGRLHSNEDYTFSAKSMPRKWKRYKFTKSMPNKYKIVHNTNERNIFQEQYDMSNKRGHGKMNFKTIFQGMITILKNIMKIDNKALELYAWLPTAVDLQKMIHTFLDILIGLKQGHYVTRKRIEFFKYTLYLFETSRSEFLESLIEYRNHSEYIESRYGQKKKSKKGVLPPNKRKDKKQPLIMWKDFAHYIRKVNGSENKLQVFDKFEDFLDNLLYNLRDLHEAIKHIAAITKYQAQNWFQDLKDIYLAKASRKQIGQVILHLSLVNLFDKIQKDSKNGVEVDFRSFIKNNEEDVLRSNEDFIFVQQILHELNEM